MVRDCTGLSEWDDEVTQVFPLARETDVVVGDEHLSYDVPLVEGCPKGAVRVSVQLLALGQPEGGPVPLVLRSGIQVPEISKPHKLEVDNVNRVECG